MKISELIAALEAVQKEHGGDLKAFLLRESTGTVAHFKMRFLDVEPLKCHLNDPCDIPDGTPILAIY